MAQSPFTEVRRLVEMVYAIASDIGVLAVINVKTLTRELSDYSHHSMRTSFLSEAEADGIIDALRGCGFYAHHFANEQDFFAWVLAGGPDSLAVPRQFVYTSALNGSGPGRRALVPAFCSHFSITTLNSDAYSCAINRQKFHASRLLQSFGVSVPRTWYFIPDRGWFDGDKPTIGTPIVAKATYEGSSVGVDPGAVGPFSANAEARISFLSAALRQPITVQALIPGFEVEVPIVHLDAPTALGAAALTIDGEDRLDDAVLMYDDAFVDKYGFTDTGNLSGATVTRIKRMAERAADVLNFRGISRIDFRVTSDGLPFVIDVSSTPHLTPNNSTGFLFARAGMRYQDIFATLVGVAIERDARQVSDQNSISDGRNPLP